MLISFEY